MIILRLRLRLRVEIELVLIKRNNLSNKSKYFEKSGSFYTVDTSKLLRAPV